MYQVNSMPEQLAQAKIDKLTVEILAMREEARHSREMAEALEAHQMAPNRRRRLVGRADRLEKDVVKVAAMVAALDNEKNTLARRCDDLLKSLASARAQQAALQLHADVVRR